MSKAIPFFTGGLAAVCLTFSSGCSGVAPNKTVSGAGTGAAAGAIAGGVIGNNTGSGNQVQGAVVGGLVGAATGAIVGAIGQAKEDREQERLANERAYQQEIARNRAQQARFQNQIQEELDVAKGFRTSEEEVAQRQAAARDLESQLKALQEERQAALQRTKDLEAAEGRIAAAQQEIERLTADIAELKGSSTIETKPSVTRDAPNYIVHKVRQGENIDSIAAYYKVPKAQIVAANDGVDTENLSVGQTLRIPAGSVSST